MGLGPVFLDSVPEPSSLVVNVNVFMFQKRLTSDFLNPDRRERKRHWSLEANVGDAIQDIDDIEDDNGDYSPADDDVFLSTVV